MADSYDLSKLGSEAFENIVNFLALKTLGLGSTGFGPGADGGRDGYFEGEAPYPSVTKPWKGIWYIQSKFHKPHLSKDPQKWLIEQVKKEIEAFDQQGSDRIWPHNWIIATNIDPSGKPETGSFDTIKKMLKQSPGGKKVNVHVWGGRKILDLLALHGDVAKYYGHFLTPGHVLTALYEDLIESRASVEEIIRYFVVTQFNDNRYTKLEQAGSSSDVRPEVHDLFIDLPFRTHANQQSGEILAELCRAAAQCHRYSLRNEFPDSWRGWNRHSKRARVFLIKGGPGQGKSTVGQYLCQIHRACLILDSDGPKVVDAIKVAANAVCDAAQRDGFWPTSPRIAIQIELKEFAHWYSQQPSNGILTYLAETVAKKIGSEVLVKTLKKALARRSWIVVFDGLDEVPNDHKDKIANEVMYFLNDVLVEIDADVLALCTSRPQGYSGQFDGLDGPVLGLALLDESEAMRCAKPLLKFRRTPEESEKSIEILETAILSPNVKELMTTPLQSHIMAVVVREGGRPPERRWQLFNGFYLVMKKRESLKDFKNPRIAQLLQEDLLLKSVHMRLGFVLHARAERSEGAQTALNKDEFRSLVHAVVTEQNDHEIEQTVTDVMEAITERLVLVSTPENGEQIRFDIRQLQEFFAAEFLYTGIDSVELGHRIETIGGDAHWREVMHFLMSALIGNQRTTEVAVAVQVLRRLNEGDEGSSDNLYCRRMTRAGLLASRLLIEGVLEQDQRDRHIIKPLIDPLGGIFDLETLRGLDRITPPKSRKWLVDLLLDKVASASPREYMGALFLLGLMLPDEHSASVQVLKSFNASPIGWQEQLYKLWAPNGRSRYHRVHLSRQKEDGIISLWVIDRAVDILNSPNWVFYSPDLIGRLLGICLSEKERFIACCKIKGIAEDIADAILQCLIIDGNQIEHLAKERVDCGLISAAPYSENWANGKVPPPLMDINAKNFTIETEGVFKFMLTCVWFAQERNDLALTEFIRLVDNADVDKIEVLPHRLLALLPIGGTQSAQLYNIDHLRNIDTTNISWLTDLATEQKISPLYANLALDIEKASCEQWRLLADRLPIAAISLAFNSDIYSSKLKPIFVPELVLLLQNMSNLTIGHLLKWGALQENQPELFESLKANACALSSQKIHFWPDPQDKVFPFELKFPEDIQLLSFLAPAIMEQFRFSQQVIFHSDSDLTEEWSLLTKYGLSIKQLRAIAESSSYSQAARAGAIALYWLSVSEVNSQSLDKSETKLNLIWEKELYTELVNEINEAWLTQALIKGVLIRNSETNTDALAFVTYLMERCQDGGGPRDEVIELIRNWRERSTAPVHSKQVLEQWLGYKFQAPAYAM